MIVRQVNLAELKDYVMSRPSTYTRTGIRLHHNAVTNQSGLSRAQADADYHTNSLGWSVPGYHVQIDPNVSERYYLIAPMEGKANHIGDGYNTEEIAICAQGNYSEQQPTSILLTNIGQACKIIAEKYQVDPHPGFHRDVDVTQCPGYNITHELVNSYLEVSEMDSRVDILIEQLKIPGGAEYLGRDGNTGEVIAKLVEDIKSLKHLLGVLADQVQVKPDNPGTTGYVIYQILEAIKSPTKTTTEEVIAEIIKRLQS